MNIYDIEILEVLLNDRNTRKEAEKHIQQHTATVYTPENWIESLKEETGLLEEILQSAEVNSEIELLELCKTGKLNLDGINSGIYHENSESPDIPYIIEYCL